MTVSGMKAIVAVRRATRCGRRLQSPLGANRLRPIPPRLWAVEWRSSVPRRPRQPLSERPRSRRSRCRGPRRRNHQLMRELAC